MDAVFADHGLDALDWRALYREALSDALLRRPPHGSFFGATLLTPAKTGACLVPHEARNAHSRCEWIAVVDGFPAAERVHLISTRRARYECTVDVAALRSLAVGQRTDAASAAPAPPGVGGCVALSLAGIMLVVSTDGVFTLRCDVVDSDARPVAPMLIARALSDSPEADGVETELCEALRDALGAAVELAITADGSSALLACRDRIVAFDTAPLRLRCVVRDEGVDSNMPSVLMHAVDPQDARRRRLVFAWCRVAGSAALLRDVSSFEAAAAPFCAADPRCTLQVHVPDSPLIVLHNCQADNLLMMADNDRTVTLIDAFDGHVVDTMRAITFDRFSGAFDPVTRDLVTSNWQSRVLLHRDSTRRASVFATRPSVDELVAVHGLEHKFAKRVFGDSDGETANREQRRYVREFHYAGHTSHIRAVAMTPSLVLSLADDTVRIWPRDKPRELFALRSDALQGPARVAKAAAVPSVATPPPASDVAHLRGAFGLGFGSAPLFARADLGLIFVANGASVRVISARCL